MIQFLLHVASKIVATAYSPISDCDEVFNYWEALHYMQHGFAFQTWEYAPKYALRSWAFIKIFDVLSIPASTIYSLLQIPFPQEKVAVFYFIRAVIALASLLSEITLALSIRNHLDARLSNLYLFFVTFSPGFFISSASLLPSSFGMIFITLAFALSLGINAGSKRQVERLSGIILSVTIAGLWGWPFCLAFGGFFILSRLAQGDLFNKLFSLVSGGIISLLLVTIPLIILDSSYYGKITLPAWNLVTYNVFSGSERGPQLYGVEPWWFYFANGFLNFNICFVFSVISLPLLVMVYVTQQLNGLQPFKSSGFTITNHLQSWSLFWNLVPLYLWLAIFTMQPHKEERFLYVFYPILCFNASISVYLLLSTVERAALYFKHVRKYAFRISSLLRYTICSLFLCLSVLRVVALIQFYGSSLSIYSGLHNAPPPGIQTSEWRESSQTLNAPEYSRRELFVCTGKEWFRFPSHYLIPPGMRFKFIKSRFSGLLPHTFGNFTTEKLAINEGLDAYVRKLQNQPRAYSFSVPNVNDLNQYESDRVIDISNCDYLIDRIPEDHRDVANNTVEPNFSHSSDWREVWCLPFIDASKTKLPARAFYFGNQRVWQQYCLYVRSHLPV